MDRRAVVDRYLDAPKRVAGRGQWEPTERLGVQTWSAHLTLNGEVTELQLRMKAYTAPPITGEFRIILTLGYCVWRLCFVRSDGHVNPAVRPRHLPLGPLDCPHYHGWEDNRSLATAAALPKRLKYANRLPDEIADFDTALRWFCAQTNIVFAEDELPTFPRSDTLL